MRAWYPILIIVLLGAGAGVLRWRDGRPAEQAGKDQPGIDRAGIDRAGGATAALPAPGEQDTRAPAPMARPAPPRLPDPAAEAASADRAAEQDTAHAAGPDGDGDGDGDLAVTPTLVYQALARDLPRKLPGLDLSDRDMERLTQAVLRVRDHQHRLRRLAHTADNAAEIRRHQALLSADLLVFEDITGMSATDFTSALSDEGITTEEPEHAAPVYRPLSAPPQ